MIIKNTVIEAIKKINPDANVSVGNDSIDEITWVEGTTPISKTDIQNKIDELAVEAAAVKYKTDREPLYPSLGDFADAMYWNSKGDSSKLTAYYAACEKVKTDNPKPS